MPPDPAPAAILALAEARAQARRAHDWPSADRLKGEIEVAGWKVIDAGTMYDLVRAVAPTIVDGDAILYGSSAAVPSRLEEPPLGVATVVIVSGDGAQGVERAVSALLAHAPTGTGIVLVANAPSDETEAAMQALEAAAQGERGIGVEIVRTSIRLSRAAALNAGIRRATAPVVILLDPAVEPLGDIVTPLAAALEAAAVGVAGAFGLMSNDVRRFAPAEEGRTVVDAIDARVMAFRRADYVDRGPLDEGFGDDLYLDVWWSFVLRDTPGDAEGDDDVRAASRPNPPRQAVVVGGLRIAVAGEQPPAGLGPSGTDDRRSRKGMYRFLKWFATREDLLVDREQPDR